MIAVLFVTSSAVTWSALWLSLAVLAMGIAPFVSWPVLARPAVKRIGLGLLVAVFCSTTLGAVICVACSGCDPWWLETFWICWPV